MRSRVLASIAAALVPIVLCVSIVSAAPAMAPAHSIETGAFASAEDAFGGGVRSWFKQHRDEIIDVAACFATGVAVGVLISGGLPPVAGFAAVAAATRCL
jgi:hypothetical protein